MFIIDPAVHNESRKTGGEKARSAGKIASA